MVKKVLVTYNYSKEKMKSIEDLGYDITIINERDVRYSNQLNDIEVLVCYNPFEVLDISKMKGLKWIQLSSIGVDQLPMEGVRNSGILVTNNRGGYSIPMGEWVVLKTLEMFKRSKKLYQNQSDKRWKIDTSLLELYGKTIGFIGTGSIAVESAKRFQGFDVKVLGVNTNGRDVQYFDKCYPLSKIHDMLSFCDVVVLTIPFTEETYHLIDEKMFEVMKQGVYFINVARGNIIDENALIQNIENGKIGAAALDVFEEEPLKEDNPLWELDNVIVTSHNSWVSEMRNERRFQGIYNNLERYIKDEELINVVDLQRGY